MNDPTRFAAAIAAFDTANAADPHRTILAGQEIAEALLYSKHMTDWLARLEPAASEPLRLATRCQHICRWMIPRQSYPMNRAGYHQWRDALAQFHADKAAEILRQVGYEEPTIARVRALVRKEGLKTDPETQSLEDVICLVFLESYFSDFARKHDEKKLLTILRKTWRKMSERGRNLAMQIKLSDADRKLIERAINPGE